MAKHLMVVLTDCTPGREAEFNEWYDNIHVPAILEKVPEITSAQRYMLSDTQRRNPAPDQRYLAIYEVDAADLPALYSSMDQKFKDAVKSPHMKRPTWAYFFTPLGQVKTKKKPR